MRLRGAGVNRLSAGSRNGFATTPAPRAPRLRLGNPYLSPRNPLFGLRSFTTTQPKLRHIRKTALKAASRSLDGGFGMLCNYNCVSILDATYMNYLLFTLSLSKGHIRMIRSSRRSSSYGGHIHAYAHSPRADVNTA